MHFVARHQVAYVDLLRLEPLLQVVFLALESVDQCMQLFGLLSQLGRVESVDLEWLDALLQYRFFLGLQLLLGLAPSPLHLHHSATDTLSSLLL